MAHKVGRIESEIILQQIQEQKQTIVLQYTNTQFFVIIDSVDGAQLSLRRVAPSDNMLLMGRIVQLFFTHRYIKMTIMPRVLQDTGDRIILKIESPAYRDISRKCERIHHDLFTDISVLDNTISREMHYPHTMHTISTDDNRYNSSRLPHDIQSLTKSLFVETRKHGMHAKIVTFRTHGPRNNTEELCAYLGCPLIVPYHDQYAQNLDIVSPTALARAMKNLHIPTKNPPLSQKDHISDIPSCQTQILAPIIHLNYCVGYVLCGTDSVDHTRYPDYIKLINHYSYAMRFALQQCGYLDILSAVSGIEKQHNRLVDISASGLRFSCAADQHAYAVGNSIKMLIRIHSHDVPIEFVVSAEVVHVEKRTKLHHIAVKFTAHNFAFFSFINKYLYSSNKEKISQNNNT